VPLTVFLHGFGARYDLPGSLWLYLFAAGGVVVISFVMVAVFAGEKLGGQAVQYPRRRSGWLTAAARVQWPWITGRVIGIAALLTVVVTGLFGSTEALRNPSEYIVWIYFWAGLVIFSGLFGNLWSLLNPWAALNDLISSFVRMPRARPLPTWLGVWPAVAIYFGFACLELTSGLAGRPRVIGSAALLYTLFTLAGMALYGRDAWLSRCEAFTVLFEIVGRFAPIETERDSSGRVVAVDLRPWGVGLLKPLPGGWDRIVFVVLMLSTLAFDGIVATPAWQSFSGTLAPWWLPFGQVGFFAVRTIGLVLLTVTFLLVFIAFMQLVLLLGAAKIDRIEAIKAFALTLVPIALVYNAAHNYSYLVVQSQALVPLLADPLGWGWSLLPTAGYKPSFALANVAVVWYAQIILIVLGHVIAVYLAHLRAGEQFKKPTSALLSQYPMLLLMVLYTMTSLWILAQPITREV
jgi:hypothetical protein